MIEENGIFKTTINLSFDTPSRVGELVSGQSTNGWTFFEGLRELQTLDHE